MSTHTFWKQVDEILERHKPLMAHLPDPAEVEAALRADQAAYERNLGILKEVLDSWEQELKGREFVVSENKVEERGLSLKYHRYGYQGKGGSVSMKDRYGNLVAAWFAPGSVPLRITIHTDPDLSAHLGRRFSRDAFESFLRNNLLTYLDDANLLHDQASWHKWRKELFSKLRHQFNELRDMPDRQAAGREFEAFLERLFTLEGLAPRGSFRVVGEQIDGSFLLDHETYLVEAKWEKDPLDNKELYAFREKIEGKSPHTRGVLIAVNGITKDAEVALQKGKTLRFFVVVGEEVQRVVGGDVNLVELLSQRQRLLAEEGAVLDHQGLAGPS